MGETGRGTESMGRNEGMAELMMKTLEGTTQNRNLPNEKLGFSLISGE